MSSGYTKDELRDMTIARLDKEIQSLKEQLDRLMKARGDELNYEYKTRKPSGTYKHPHSP
jgi:ribosomal protein L29